MLVFGSLFLPFFLPRPVFSAGEEKRVERLKPRVVAILTHDDRKHPFSFPSFLYYDIHQDEFYVIESTRAEVVVFTPDFFPFFSFGPGRGALVPTALTINKDGTLYLAQGTGEKNPDHAMLTVFNAADIKVRDILFKGFDGADRFYPKSIALGASGNLYVAGLEYPGIVVLTREGKFVKYIAPKDTFLEDKASQKAIITDVYVDWKGRLYLLSEKMGRFYVYDQNDHFLFKAGIKGGSSGKLSRPRGICADPKRGVIYVIDYLRHTGLGYDYKTGKFLFEFGGRGWSPGWFNFPTDIAVDARGRVYVADLFNHRVQVLEFPKPKKISPKLKIEMEPAEESPTIDTDDTWRKGASPKGP